MPHENATSDMDTMPSSPPILILPRPPPNHREKFDEAFGEGSTSNGTVKRHARENHDKAIAAVQESERKMNIVTRWTDDGKEWEAAALLVSNRRYRICVDRLESLVVKRLFELTKMNMSQTGAFSALIPDQIIEPMHRIQAADTHCKSPPSTVQDHQECSYKIQLSCKGAESPRSHFELERGH